MNKSCLVIGDLNIDIILSEAKKAPSCGSEIKSDDYYLDIGGSGGIFAAVLSELGIKTYIYSIIGKDYFGKFLIDKLKDFKVETGYIISQSNYKSGITMSLPYRKDKYQISSVDIFRDLQKGLKIMIKEIPSIENLSHIHFTSYYMMRSLNNDYKDFIKTITQSNKNITFSLDTNDDPENNWHEDIFEVLKNIEILFLNEKESLRISREKNIQQAIERFSRHVKTTVVKLGKKGFIAKENGVVFKQKALDAENLDSTGAGDNFDAGYIFGFLNNLSSEKSLKIANILGSRSIEYMGGVNEEPKYTIIRKEIKSLIG